jgi:LPXTG-motif cell wall-anchored protein
LLGLLVGALALVSPAQAEHNPAAGGQFCGNDHQGDVHQSEDGDWYICEEQGDDTQPRWYPTSEPVPSPTPTIVPTVEPSDTPPPSEDDGEDEGDTGAGGEADEESLPRTGASTALIAGGAVALLALGGGLFLVARRRRVRFTA